MVDSPEITTDETLVTELILNIGLKKGICLDVPLELD